MAKKSKKSKKASRKGFEIIAHPFLAAIYPVIFLLAYNIKETYVGSIAAPLVVSCAAALALFFGIDFFIRDRLKTGIITTAALLAFFSYGHLFRLLSEVEIGDFKVFGHIILVPLLVFLAYLAADALIKTGKLKEINMILNIVFALLTATVISQAAYGMAVYHKAAFTALNRVTNKASGDARKNFVPGSYPDIYYIILDGHARQDIAEELYGGGISGFYDYLRKKGFYVAKKSRPNYCQTFLSLASSFNMEYLDSVAKRSEKGDVARIYLGEMIRHNKTVDLLRGKGYVWVSYFTGFVGTELKRIADIYLPGENVFAEEMSEFNTILADSTLLYGIGGIMNAINPDKSKKSGTFIAFARRTQYVIENIHKSAEIRSPKLVFAHIVAPHPPFVFDINGPTGKFAGTGGAVFAAGDQNRLPRDEYRKAYREQMLYVDRHMKGTVDRLLSATDGKAVIIIQADHGPGSEWFVNNYEKTNKRERFSILNAYYLPGGGEKGLYETITPVNTFRLIFREYFNMDMPPLPDKSYYSAWDDPFKFTEVPEETENLKLKTEN